MGVLEDMLNALDRFEWWKELRGAPKRIEELERQVAELGEKLGGKWPGEVCRFCGARASRLYHVYPSTDAKGNVREIWRCGECNREDQRFSRPCAR